MRNLLVTYDLRKEGMAYPHAKARIEVGLRQLGVVKHIVTTTWFLKNTPYTASQVRDHLLNFIDQNDSLFVVEVADWASYVAKTTNDWLVAA